jgi:hypothetical protein
MPYVHRNAMGAIESVHRVAVPPQAIEYLDVSNAELQRFFGDIDHASIAGAIDVDFIDALGDIVDVMLAKGLVAVSELPLPAQAKLVAYHDRRAQAALARSRQFAASGFVEVIDDSAFDQLGGGSQR